MVSYYHCGFFSCFNNSQPRLIEGSQYVHQVDREKWAELSLISSPLNFQQMKEGMMEGVSEVEVHDVPGKPMAFQA